MIEKIVSGGQTGVDRAALDAALERGVPCGGWCPKGRRAEDGVVPAAYPLTETPGADYAERTERNVRDSDGTLVLTRGEPSGGTGLTADLARAMDKPLLIVDLALREDAATVLARIVDWSAGNRVRILNVAGPRESTHPGIYDAARRVIDGLLGRRGA